MSLWRIVQDWKWDRDEGVFKQRSVLDGPVDVGGLRIRRGTREEWKSVYGGTESFPGRAGCNAGLSLSCLS
ncbi:hypothetical protein HYY74_00465 [Candidatus Woesearchaeota archaeon]|nr:hypothetical protein [Candidatus Woesearchaeota archaeon]